MAMRRTEKEITDRDAIDAVIRRCQVCRLGMVDGDVPYVIPLCFGYDGRCLYFHCAPAGRKLDVLRRNNRVCFEFDLLEGLVEADEACSWGIRYRSVIGTGTAHIVEDAAGKRQALTALMAQYSPKAFTFPEGTLARTLAIRVTVDSITGKQSAR